MGFLELDYCEAEMSQSNFMPIRSLQQNRFTTCATLCAAMYEEANAAFVAGAFLKIKCFLPYRNSKFLWKIKIQTHFLITVALLHEHKVLDFMQALLHQLLQLLSTARDRNLTTNGGSNRIFHG
jgi:hypothetical protein